ncbi:MAG TPA: hypothetical protein VH054_22120 [Polyangiaceae bacterium]|jgi:hypothetical protein|nr:hypothetical protein [Polyangiaceae bacterium]
MRLLSGFGLLFFVACVGDSTAPVDASTDATTDAQPADASTTDAADSTAPVDVTQEPAPFDPSQISSLVLWLDADDAQPDVSSKVSAWTDKSPHHNDAKQTTEADAPDLTGALINAHKSVHFTIGSPGTFLTIADGASMQWDSGFVLEIVMRHDSVAVADDEYLFSKEVLSGNISGPIVFLQSNSGPEFVWSRVDKNTNINTQGQAALVESVGHRLRFSWDGTNESLQVDKNAAVVGTFSNVTNVGAAGAIVNIGYGGTNNTNLHGDIAEIVAVSGGTINPSDITKLEAYLDTKYGL